MRIAAKPLCAMITEQFSQWLLRNVLLSLPQFLGDVPGESTGDWIR